MATIGAKSRDLERNEPTFIQFYRMVPAAGTPSGQPYLIFQDELLACDLDDPPDFKWKNPSCTTSPSLLPSLLLFLLLHYPVCEYGLIGVGNGGVAIYRICSLTSDLTGTPLERFTKHTNSLGDVYYRVNFELWMSFLGKVQRIEVRFDGMSCAEITAESE